MEERIGFGLYQSSGDRGSVGRGLRQGSGTVGWCESGFTV